MNEQTAQPLSPEDVTAYERLLEGRADAAAELHQAILAYLDPENQYPDSRRHAMDEAERRLLATLDAARAASPSDGLRVRPEWLATIDDAVTLTIGQRRFGLTTRLLRLRAALEATGEGT